MSNGYNWALYDQQYPLQRASSDQPAHWSVLNQQAHNKVKRKGKSPLIALFRSNQPLPANTHILITPQCLKTCFAFHSSGKCCTSYPCAYRHNCFRCMSRHLHPTHRCGLHTDSPRTQASWQPSNKSSWGFKRTQGWDRNAFYQCRWITQIIAGVWQTKVSIFEWF